MPPCYARLRCAIYRCLLVTRAVLSGAQANCHSARTRLERVRRRAPEVSGLAYARFFDPVSLRLETRFDRVVSAKHERVGNPSRPSAGRLGLILAGAHVQSESKKQQGDCHPFTALVRRCECEGLLANARAKYQPKPTHHGYHDGHRRWPQQQRRCRQI